MASRRRCDWTGQFYSLRAGSPRRAAFSGWWKVAGLRAGQRHASVQGTVPRRKVGILRVARGNQTTEMKAVKSGCCGAISNSGANIFLLCDIKEFVVLSVCM